jgi:hypothetical protein
MADYFSASIDAPPQFRRPWSLSNNKVVNLVGDPWLQDCGAGVNAYTNCPYRYSLSLLQRDTNRLKVA